MPLFRFLPFMIAGLTLSSGFAEERPPTALSAEDQQGIGATIDGFVDGWNKRDMTEFGSIMAENCEWVNVVGMHWKGHEQVVRAHTRLLQGRYKGVNIHSLSHQESSLAPGVALVLWTSSLDDFTTPTGERVVGTKDLATLVMIKQGSKWLIRSGQNTTVDAQAAMHDPGK